MTVTNLLLGILVVGLLIYRQWAARPVQDDFRPVILQARARRLAR